MYDKCKNIGIRTVLRSGYNHLRESPKMLEKKIGTTKAPFNDSLHFFL